MNAVEIEEAISDLALQPFDAVEFPFAFLAAFGNKDTTLKRLRVGNSNKSDIPGGVLQTSNIHIAVCEVGAVGETLKTLRASPATTKAKAKFILATDGQTLEAEEMVGGETVATVPFLLKGIVFGNDGRALSPWYTTKKNGHRYRYYLPQRDAKEYAGASGLPRLPAAQLESAVLEQLRAILRQPALIAEIVPQAIKLDPTLDEAKVTVAMTRLDAIWDQLFPAEQGRIVRLLLEKVIVSPINMELRLRANGIEQVVMELQSVRAARAEREEGALT